MTDDAPSEPGYIVQWLRADSKRRAAKDGSGSSLLSSKKPTAEQLQRERARDEAASRMRTALESHLQHFLASARDERAFTTFCRALSRVANEYPPDAVSGFRHALIGSYFEAGSTMRRPVGRPRASTEHAPLCLHLWHMINLDRAELGMAPLKRAPAAQIAARLHSLGWLELTPDEVRRMLRGFVTR